jgi:hypothetical protein
MSRDLRTLLQELAEDAAPVLDAMPAAQRLTSVRTRARHLRRRRAAAARLAAVALVAGAAGLVRVPVSSLIAPARPPQPATDVVPTSHGQRVRVGAVAVPVDADAVHLVATPPNLDLEFAVVCLQPLDVRVSITINGHLMDPVDGCGGNGLTASSVPTQEAFWTPFGVAPGRAMAVTISATSPNGNSPAGSRQRFAYVGVYAAPPSALPARPAPAPSVAGLRTVATAILDGEDPQVARTVRMPPTAQVWAAVSCAGQADELQYMIHITDTMVARGTCQDRPSLIPLDLTAVTRDTHTDSVVVLFILAANGSVPLKDDPPEASARIVVSLLEGRPPA